MLCGNVLVFTGCDNMKAKDILDKWKDFLEKSDQGGIEGFCPRLNLVFSRDFPKKMRPFYKILQPVTMLFAQKTLHSGDNCPSALENQQLKKN